MKRLTAGKKCGIICSCQAKCYCGSGVEQRTRNAQVVSSNLTSSSKQDRIVFYESKRQSCLLFTPKRKEMHIKTEFHTAKTRK